MVQKFLSFETRYQIREEYKRAKKKLLLLDYDGTLANIAGTPAEAKPDARILNLLDSLAGDENNIVVLLSGRDRKTLEQWFKNNRLIYGAEHGALLKLAYESEWRSIMEFDLSWKPEIKRTLDGFVNLYEGSFVEEKEYSLVWHYRLSRFKNESGELALMCKALEKLDSARYIDIKQGKKILEIGCPHANKGAAVNLLLGIYKPGFVIAIGDDTTDEDMFAALHQDGHYTVKVGFEDTKASFCLTNPGLVLSFLEFLAA